MKLIFNDALKSNFYSFKKRVFLNTFWILVIITSVLVYFLIRDGSFSLWITVPFLILIISYLVYWTYKTDYILLTYLEIDSTASKVILKANKMDNEYVDHEFDLEKVTLEVKKIFSGIGGNPNYTLNIYVNDICLIRQRGNLVWSNKRLREIGDEIGSFLKDR